MNTPTPTPPTPPPAIPQAGIQTAAPTLGSIIGSGVASLLVGKIGPTDPALIGAIMATVTGVTTALFHWAGSKLGLALS